MLLSHKDEMPSLQESGFQVGKPCFGWNLSGRASKAFTLIELLVSMAVLVCLLLLVLQIVNQTRSVTGLSSKRLDADSEARTVFDRISEDIGRMVCRKDIDYVFRQNTGNDAFFFYSEAPAITATTADEQNTASLVGYRINEAYQLERLGKGLTWKGTMDGSGNQTSMVFLTPSGTSLSTVMPESTLLGAFPNILAENSTDSNYHVIGANVFRLEVTFLLKPVRQPNGTFLPAKYSTVPWDTRAGHSSLAGIGVSDIQAIVISVAILDGATRKSLPADAIGSPTVAALADGTISLLSASPAHLPAAVWQELINAGNFSLPGFPASVSGQVRIYQRYFPINSAFSVQQ